VAKRITTLWGSDAAHEKVFWHSDTNLKLTSLNGGGNLLDSPFLRDLFGWSVSLLDDRKTVSVDVNRRRRPRPSENKVCSCFYVKRESFAEQQ
jgi:hypothetical protein